PALEDGFTLDADGDSRVFDVNTGTTVTLRGLTLTGGVADQGGAVRNAGTLTLERVTVRNSAAHGGALPVTGFGGGLYNSGTLTLLNTTVSTNTSSGIGGGLYNSGTVRIAGSTIANNHSAAS